MKIRVGYLVMKEVEIGPLEKVLRLPTAGRKRHNMKTRCDHCKREIEDETFIVGFKTGRKNMMFHEKCVPEEELQKIEEIKTDAYPGS